MQHYTTAVEVNPPSGRKHSLSALVTVAAAGLTPAEPEWLGSWLGEMPDCQFEIVADLIGDRGDGPALAHLNDSERRALLRRVASHLRSLQ